jgi:hypothetical protein
VYCTCRNATLEPIFNDPESSLPIDIGGLTLRNEKREIFSDSMYSPVELMVQFDKLRISTEEDLTKCHAKSSNMIGCYSCHAGAHLSLDCWTEFGSAMAYAYCDDGTEFTVQCHQEITHHNVSLAFSRAEIDLNCTLECTGGESNFHIFGHLRYVPKHYQSPYGSQSIVEQPENENANCLFCPDFGFDIKDVLWYFFNWKNVFVTLGIIALAVLLVFLFVWLRPVFILWRIISRFKIVILVILFTSTISVAGGFAQRNVFVAKGEADDSTFLKIQAENWSIKGAVLKPKSSVRNQLNQLELFNRLRQPNKMTTLLVFLSNWLRMLPENFGHLMLDPDRKEEVERKLDAMHDAGYVFMTMHLHPRERNHQLKGKTLSRAANVTGAFCGNGPTVSNFFELKHGIRLRYPRAPCLMEPQGTSNRYSYFPLELIRVHPPSMNPNMNPTNNDDHDGAFITEDEDNDTQGPSARRTTRHNWSAQHGSRHNSTAQFGTRHNFGAQLGIQRNLSPQLCTEGNSQLGTRHNPTAQFGSRHNFVAQLGIRRNLTAQLGTEESSQLGTHRNSSVQPEANRNRQTRYGTHRNSSVQPEVHRNWQKHYGTQRNSVPQFGAQRNSSQRFCPFPQQQRQHNWPQRNRNTVNPQHSYVESRIPPTDAEYNPDAPTFWRPFGCKPLSADPSDTLCITVMEPKGGPKRFMEKELCVRRNAHLGFDGPLRIRFLVTIVFLLALTGIGHAFELPREFTGPVPTSPVMDPNNASPVNTRPITNSTGSVIAFLAAGRFGPIPVRRPAPVIQILPSFLGQRICPLTHHHQILACFYAPLRLNDLPQLADSLTHLGICSSASSTKMSNWPHKKDEHSLCIFNLIINSKSNSNSNSNLKMVDRAQYAAKKKLVEEEAVESSDSNSDEEEEEEEELIEESTDAEDEEEDDDEPHLEEEETAERHPEEEETAERRREEKEAAERQREEEEAAAQSIAKPVAKPIAKTGGPRRCTMCHEIGHEVGDASKCPKQNPAVNLARLRKAAAKNQLLLEAAEEAMKRSKPRTSHIDTEKKEEIAKKTQAKGRKDSSSNGRKRKATDHDVVEKAHAEYGTQQKKKAAIRELTAPVKPPAPARPPPLPPMPKIDVARRIVFAAARGKKLATLSAERLRNERKKACTELERESTRLSEDAVAKLRSVGELMAQAISSINGIGTAASAAIRTMGIAMQEELTHQSTMWRQMEEEFQAIAPMADKQLDASTPSTSNHLAAGNVAAGNEKKKGNSNEKKKGNSKEGK